MMPTQIVTTTATHTTWQYRIAYRKKLRKLFSLVLVLTLGCTHVGVISVVPGSTTHHLIFELGRWYHDHKPIGLQSIQVMQCTDPITKMRWVPRWRLFLTDSPRLKQITYGTTEFSSELNRLLAQPIVPGDYKVLADFDEGWHAMTYFTVSVNGDVVERGPF